jgi:carbon starvation protein
MLGVANQLLATTALCVGTAYIINSGRARFAWVTGVPMLFVGTTTLCAGFLLIKDSFLPKHKIEGYVDAACAAVLMVACAAVLIESAIRWTRQWAVRRSGSHSPATRTQF